MSFAIKVIVYGPFAKSFEVGVQEKVALGREPVLIEIFPLVSFTADKVTLSVEFESEVFTVN